MHICVLNICWKVHEDIFWNKKVISIYIVVKCPLFILYVLYKYCFSSPEHEVLMVSYCGQWLSVVRRALSFVCHPPTFNIYVCTLETTFVRQFWWNFVRMFVLTISRPSSNMGHVGSKTRSPGQILGNSCVHSRGHFMSPLFDETWSKCLFWQYMYIGQVRKYVMSGQKLGHLVNSCLQTRRHICDPILLKLRQNVCFVNM